jgi:hypothetical protein
VTEEGCRVFVRFHCHFSYNAIQIGYLEISPTPKRLTKP